MNKLELAKWSIGVTLLMGSMSLENKLTLCLLTSLISISPQPLTMHQKVLFTTSTKPCLVNNFQLGYCKYGDRCTFAHGDVDLKPKFVPASTVYPDTAPEMTQDSTMQATQINQSPSYGIDYSSFSQPSDAFQVFSNPEQNYSNSTAFTAFDQGDDYQNQQVSFGGSQMASVPFSGYGGMGMNNGFHDNQFKSPGNNFMNQETSSNVYPGFTPYGMSSKNETSKYGFVYDSHADNIDELEPTDPKDETTKNRLNLCRKRIQEGLIEEANAMLSGMLKTNKLTYKNLSNLENNIINPFSSISDLN